MKTMLAALQAAGVYGVTARIAGTAPDQTMHLHHTLADGLVLRADLTELDIPWRERASDCTQVLTQFAGADELLAAIDERDRARQLVCALIEQEGHDA